MITEKRKKGKLKSALYSFTSSNTGVFTVSMRTAHARSGTGESVELRGVFRTGKQPGTRGSMLEAY